MKIPTLSFVAGTAGSGQMADENGVLANLDALAEFGAFIEGTSRSGKTNVGRVFCEQTYGVVQHIILDPEGQYPSLRSAGRPYLIIGKGRDVELVLRLVGRDVDGKEEWEVDGEAVARLILAVVDRGVSVIFDMSDYDLSDQYIIVRSIADALVTLPESHPRTTAVIIEELQDYAPDGGGKDTSHNSVRRLAKRGLKRGVFMLGVSQRVADVSKGVITQLKTKIIGGTDHKDAKRALEELGMSPSDRQLVTDLEQGQFWVKGPAFERHAQIVRAPLSETAPPKRRRGEPPAPAADAPAEIAALAATLRQSATEAAEKAAAAAAEQTTRRRTPSGSSIVDDEGEIAALAELFDPSGDNDNPLYRAVDELIGSRVDHVVRAMRTSLRGAFERFDLEIGP